MSTGVRIDRPHGSGVNMRNILGIFFLCTFAGYAQTPEWINFTYGEQVFDLIQKGDDLWIATGGGLVRFERKTERLTWYTTGSSNLPENKILSVARDSLGAIWVGTQHNGVGRFDGSSCQVFNTANSGLPYDQWGTEIAVDSSGCMWFGTEKYLSRFDGRSWQSYTTAWRGNTSMINKIVFDRAGTPWIATDFGGLGKFAKDTVLQKFDGFQNPIYALAVDSTNNLWIGEHGLIRYDGVTKTAYNTGTCAIPSNIIWDIKFDARGNLWLASGAGLIRFDGINWNLFNPDGPPISMFRVEVDPNGAVWVGSLGDGLAKFDGVSWKKFRLSNSGLQGNTVSSFALDTNGNRWVVSNGPLDVLACFDGKRWIQYDTTRYAFLDSNFTRIYTGISRKIWTGSGILISHDTSVTGSLKWNVSTVCDRHRGGKVRTDRFGNVWEATDQGLRKYDGTSWSTYTTVNSPFLTNNISTIAFDLQDNLWVGTIPSSSSERGRLIKFDGTNWTVQFTCEKSYQVVSAIDFVSPGKIWIGILSTATIGVVYGGGVKVFDGANWISYDVYNSALPSNSVATLVVDKDEHVWIGTYGGGMAKFDGKSTWTVFDTDNSRIPNDNIEVIEIDGFNNKWICPQAAGLTVFREDGTVLTDVHPHDAPRISNNFLLSQNYPNPFNPSTTISFNLPSREFVSLKIFDVMGREVATLSSEEMTAGSYSKQWNASGFPSGVYFYRLLAGPYAETKRLVLLR